MTYLSVIAAAGAAALVAASPPADAARQPAHKRVLKWTAAAGLATGKRVRMSLVAAQQPK